jgi:hypothetical protein
MNKRELETIKDMMKELEYLKKQIKSSSEQLNIVHDSVRGSSPIFPYIEHTIMITGIEDKDLCKRVKQLRYDLSGKIQEIMDKVDQAQAYISTIPDADTRIILQCRYINNMTWEQIEGESGMSRITAIRKHRKWENDIE